MNANRATAIVGVDVGVVGIVTEDPPETPPPEEIGIFGRIIIHVSVLLLIMRLIHFFRFET